MDIRPSATDFSVCRGDSGAALFDYALWVASNLPRCAISATSFDKQAGWRGGKQVKGILKTLKQKGRNLARKRNGKTDSRAKMVTWYKHHIRKGEGAKAINALKPTGPKIGAGRKNGKAGNSKTSNWEAKGELVGSRREIR